jgi:ABC-type amino acid transport substrate-binding protein
MRPACATRWAAAVAAAAALLALCHAQQETAAAPKVLDLLPAGGGLKLSNETLSRSRGYTNPQSVGMFHNSNYNTNFSLKWSTFDNPAPRYQKPYNVCVSQWTPMIDCAGRVNPNEWAGYQIEMNRIMARDLGWADDEWFMHCVQWTPMLDDLVDPNGNCIMAAAGVEVILENYDVGLKFSAPVYKSGLQVRQASSVRAGLAPQGGAQCASAASLQPCSCFDRRPADTSCMQVLIHATISTPDNWAFTNVFSWQVSK